MPPVKVGRSTAYLGFENVLDTVLNVGLKDVRLGELLVPVGRQPDAGQRALLGEHKVCVEHLQAFTNMLPSTLSCSRICKLAICQYGAKPP